MGIWPHPALLADTLSRVESFIDVFVYVYILLPVMFVAWIAFFDQDIIVFPPQGYTLKWFSQVWERRAYQRGFVTSFQVAAVAMVCGVTLGSLASIPLVRSRFPLEP